jgi:hypothetical protein
MPGQLAINIHQGNTAVHPPTIVKAHEDKRPIPVTLSQQTRPRRVMKNRRLGATGDEVNPRRQCDRLDFNHA